MPDDQLAAAEAAYLDARDLLDRLGIAGARGNGSPDLAARAATATAAARAAITAAGDPGDAEDRRALGVMRQWADGAGDGEDPEPGTDESWAATAERGFGALSGRIAAGYAIRQGAVDTGGVTMTRLGVLERLAIEPDADVRRRLFRTLAPVWRAIDGDGGPASPYRRLLGLSAGRWAAGLSPVDRNAVALGIDPTDVEPQLVAILSTWRATFGGGATGAAGGGAPIEPWDWWYATGAAARALRAAAPVHRIAHISGAYHASLGADPGALGIGFDVFPRAGRPLVPVAYTDFGGRARLRPDGTRQPAKAWVMGTYTAGGLGELTELVHETGHAIHVAGIDTRPAFADWPDSDAFTEGVAELTALDTAEPAWQRHWLGAEVPGAVSLRGRYADVMLDICWALLEIRLHADPARSPGAVWAELTSTYLGIVAHPELAWWAMRGQLVQEPGYMVNYALGPILAADLRAAIRAARGDWSAGDPGWYGWVSARVYRWGLERTSGEVLAAVLGRAPDAGALLAEIDRARVTR